MLKRTLQIFGIAFLFGLLLTITSYAAVNLKKVQVTDGSQVDLLFDQKIAPHQVKVEYVRDIIQLSLNGVSVYPAKVSTVSGSELSKVFAYQYSPDLVRCRLTVKGDASRYENRVQVKVSGKTVTLRIAAASTDAVASTAASAARAKSEPEAKAELAQEEKQLLDRVMKNESAAKAEAKAKSDSAKSESKSEKSKKNSSESARLTGGKNLPTPMKSVGMMLLTIGILGGFLLFLKKAKGQKLFKSDAKGISKFIGKLTGNAHQGMIEVVATHHLAPKKSIVMVKIQNRMLVLGMTNDGVNLITEFNAADEASEGEEPVNVRAFAEGLKKFESDEDVGPASASKSDGMGAFAGILTKAFSQAAGPAVSGSKAAAPAAKSQASTSGAAAGPSLNRGGKPASAARSAGALNAYASSSRSASSDANFSESPAIAAAMKGESARTSIRAQIRNKVEGLKNL